MVSESGRCPTDHACAFPGSAASPAVIESRICYSLCNPARGVRDTTAVNGYPHPDVPFDRIVGTLQPGRGALHSPVFQAVFILQNVPGQELVLPGLITTPVDLAQPSAGANFDLTLSLKSTGGELCGALEFNTALFDTTTIEHMAAKFENLLTAIVRTPDACCTQPVS